MIFLDIALIQLFLSQEERNFLVMGSCFSIGLSARHFPISSVKTWFLNFLAFSVFTGVSFSLVHKYCVNELCAPKFSIKILMFKSLKTKGFSHKTEAFCWIGSDWTISELLIGKVLNLNLHFMLQTHTIDKNFWALLKLDFLKSFPSGSDTELYCFSCWNI